MCTCVYMYMHRQTERQGVVGSRSEVVGSRSEVVAGKSVSKKVSK